MPLNKPSLIKAVTDLLKFEYIPNNVKFSAHDVTSRLRELVLQQAVIGAVYPIDTNETGIVVVQGQRVARIEHDDVRHIVHDLFDGKEIPGYDRVLVMDSNINANYFEYQPIQATVAPVVQDPVSPDPLPGVGASAGPWSSIS